MTINTLFVYVSGCNIVLESMLSHVYGHVYGSRALPMAVGLFW